MGEKRWDFSKKIYEVINTHPHWGKKKTNLKTRRGGGKRGENPCVNVNYKEDILYGVALLKQTICETDVHRKKNGEKKRVQPKKKKHSKKTHLKERKKQTV